MNQKLLSVSACLLISLAVGAWLGRQWQGEIADRVLTGIAWLASLVAALALANAAWLRIAARDPAAPLIAGRHLVLTRHAERWVLRLQHLGRLEFVEFALTLPRAQPLDRADAFARVLFALSLGVYAVTRLVALDEFPIYFFTDEAIHPVLASELIQRGFRDVQGNLFPAYFQNGLYWNLSLSVYLHALPTALLGKSILVTRAMSVVIGIFGAAAVGLILKLFFRVERWWLGVLLLSITPAWFLHSRTAFETALMVSFYAWFLLCYLLYRYRSPHYLFPALVFGAATFYAYSNGQTVMLASGILFLVSDFRYHLRHWRVAAWGALLLGFLALPYVSFRAQMPEAVTSHLRILNSYWLLPIPLEEKIGRWLSTYAYGLSPRYWFLPNEHDLVRHRMDGYGHLWWWTFPFFLLGVAQCVRHIKSPASRALIIAALSAPFGCAFAEIFITRALLFVLPASILTALGLDWLIGWLRTPRARQIAALGVFVSLAGVNVAMLRDARVNGPTWYTNYGLYGMQWGARQLFSQEIPALAQCHPASSIYLTPTWANGTDVLVRFFDADRFNLRLLNVDHFLTYKRDLDSNAILVMTKEEYDRAQKSGKFKEIALEQTLKYPDGNDGFYFARLAYVDDVDAIFAAEREARRHLVTETVTLNGETIPIAHSLFDGGRVQDLFDGDTFTLARGMEANPLILEFAFPQPREVRGIEGTFGKMNFRWTLLVYADAAEPPVTYWAEHRDSPGEPHVQMDFDRGPTRVSKLRIEILALDAAEPAHIHVREIQLR